MFDKETGEKHIADVSMVHNLTIEFQHSHIGSLERTSREKFYENMVWVVDGTRLKKDYPRFLKGKKNGFENQIFYSTENPKNFRVDLIDWCFPSAWLGSSVPVIFDFRGDGTVNDLESIRDSLYCLFPQFGEYARVAEISRNAFINSTIGGDWISRTQDFTEEIKRLDEIALRQQIVSYKSNNIKYYWRGISLIGSYAEYSKRLLSSNKLSRKGKR